MTDLTFEQRLSALEIAESTVPAKYAQGQGSATFLDKDMREIFLRADRIIAWASGTEEADKASLISKLRAALCETP